MFDHTHTWWCRGTGTCARMTDCCCPANESTASSRVLYYTDGNVEASSKTKLFLQKSTNLNSIFLYAALHCPLVRALTYQL